MLSTVPRCRCRDPHLVGIIAAPVAIGSLWRKLNPGQQALLVWPTCARRDVRRAGAGFGVGTDHGVAVRDETVALLAARAPKLRKAVRDAKKAGHAYVVWTGR